MTSKLLAKGTAIAATLMVASLAALPVLAEDTTVATATATPAPTLRPALKIKEDALKLRQDLKTNKAELKEDVKTMVGTLRTDHAKLHADRLERRFNFYFTRLSNIATRIQTNIDKTKAAGKNVAAVQTQLDTANTTLNQAKTDGASAVSMFRSIPVGSWDLQKPDVKAAIAQAQKARGEFVTARKQLVDVVTALKKLQ